MEFQEKFKNQVQKMGKSGIAGTMDGNNAFEGWNQIYNEEKKQKKPKTQSRPRPPKPKVGPAVPNINTNNNPPNISNFNNNVNKRNSKSERSPSAKLLKNAGERIMKTGNSFSNEKITGKNNNINKSQLQKPLQPISQNYQQMPMQPMQPMQQFQPMPMQMPVYQQFQMQPMMMNNYNMMQMQQMQQMQNMQNMQQMQNMQPMSQFNPMQQMQNMQQPMMNPLMPNQRLQYQPPQPQVKVYEQSKVNNNDYKPYNDVNSIGQNQSINQSYLGSRRYVEYKPYTLKDYKELTRTGVVMGPLGANIGTKEWEEKKLKMKKMQTYSNRINQTHKGITKIKKDTPQDEIEKNIKRKIENSHRYRTYEYGKLIRPSMQNQSPLKRDNQEISSKNDYYYKDLGVINEAEEMKIQKNLNNNVQDMNIDTNNHKQNEDFIPLVPSQEEFQNENQKLDTENNLEELLKRNQIYNAKINDIKESLLN